MLNRALYVLVVSCSLQPVSLFAQQEQEKGNAAEVSDQVTMDTEGTRGMNMALSSDGKTAAVNLTNGSILLCNALTGEVKSVLAGHQKWTWLTFSPDSRQLASGGSQDGQVRLWDVAAGRQIVQLPGHNTQVSMVDFSPDGKWLASAGFVLSDTDRDGEIKIWDIKTHQELFTLAADNGLTDIKFSRDGKYLASAEYAKKRIDLGPMSEVKIWDLKTHKIVKHIPNVCGLMSRLKFSPDGKTLAIGEYNGPVIHAASHRVQFVDTKNWQFQGALVGHTNRIFGLDYTPDGKTLVTSSSDGTLRVWDVKTRTLKKLVPTNTGNTGQLSLSKDGARFSFASKAPEVIRLGALKHNAEYLTGKMKSKSLEYIGAIRFSSDGKNLAVSRRRKAIYWDATTGTGLPPLSYFKQTPRAFSPDLRYAVTAYRTIDIWDITTGKVVNSMNSASSGTYTPVFSADGRLLAAGAPDGSIKLWEARTGKLWSAAPKQKINYPYLAFSEAGRLLAAGAYERQGGIVLWEVPPADAKAAEANAVADAKAVKTPDEVTEAYKEAQQFVTNKQSSTENLQQALSPVASLLPTIDPQIGTMPVKWHRLRANADGSGF